MGYFSTLLNNLLNLNFHLSPHMPTKANSEKPSKIEPDPSPNAKTKHRENAVDSGINLGFARYGHPDGTVYLPSDRSTQPPFLIRLAGL